MRGKRVFMFTIQTGSFNVTQTNKALRDSGMESLIALFGAENLVVYGEGKAAVKYTTINDSGVYTERWLKIAATAANNKPTKTAPAFDPFALRKTWLADVEAKAAAKEAKEVKADAKRTTPRGKVSRADDDMFAVERDADGVELFDPDEDTGADE